MIVGYKGRESIKKIRVHKGTEAYNDFLALLEDRYEEVKDLLVMASYDEYLHEMRGAAIELKTLIQQLTSGGIERIQIPVPTTNTRNDLGGY